MTVTRSIALMDLHPFFSRTWQGLLGTYTRHCKLARGSEVVYEGAVVPPGYVELYRP